MAKETKKKGITKKDISRLHREQKQRKIILIGAIAVLALVALIIIYGVLNVLVLQGTKTVAEVNGEKITLNQFQQEVRYQRFLTVNTYKQYYDLYAAFGTDLGSSFLNSLKQIESDMSNANSVDYGQKVLDLMIENRLIAQYAAQNNITVSQAEIDEALKKGFGYYPEGTPSPTATATAFATSTLSALQLSLVTPTPLATNTPEIEQSTVEAEATQENEPTVEATPTEAPQTSPTEIPSPTATFEPTPTATEYTLEGYQNNLEKYYDELKNINLPKKFLQQKFTEYLLREKVFNEITNDMLPKQEQVWARHILVADEETAKEVLQKIEEGEDWTALAAVYSTDTSNSAKGGDLGWFATGKMVAAFEEVAFALEIGEISQPVGTEFGWHIIQVLGHEVRPISASELNTLKSKQFDEWVAQHKEQSQIETYETWQEDVPLVPTIPAEWIIE